MLQFTTSYLGRRLRIALQSLVFVLIMSVLSISPILIIFLLSGALIFFTIASYLFCFAILAFIFGMIWGGYNLKVRRTTIVLPSLPQAFEGLKIVQFSDLHLGTFGTPRFVQVAVEKMRAENPDVIFFTGDLVNNRAREADIFLSALDGITAPLGVFSILGNHDYGDYVSWKSPEAKRQNHEDLLALHRSLGWKVLLNDHAVIARGGQSIAVVGVENWGHSFNFPKYGDLKKALGGLADVPVKLLLSHDPTHWKYKVVSEWPDIDVTFSGHTHGGQFGIEIGSWKWSPVQYFYPLWAGLYTKGRQHLYINRGVGMLAYSGRVGIWPELSVITLSANK